MAYIFRMESVDDPLVGKVNMGPWRGTRPFARWTLSEDFYDKNKEGVFFNTPQDYDVVLTGYDVCGANSYEELNQWFPNRHKRKGSYRVVKYYVPDRYVLRLPDQILVDAHHLKQVAVTELYVK